MAEYYVTFGFQYPREPHPRFPEAHHDGWATIVAASASEARGIAGSSIFSGVLGRLRLVS
jgi:hypothetical protein